ncbi:hypothetical protein ACVMAJ_002910 [Bradyrhizobium sp. USDA 4448]
MAEERGGNTVSGSPLRDAGADGVNDASAVKRELIAECAGARPLAGVAQCQ